MQICKDHWTKLRDAVEARDLSHLVARSGKEAMDNMVSELEGRKTDYDPLMSCNWMITSRGLELGGLYLMGVKEDGSAYCPICEALAHMAPPEGQTKEQQERHWIDDPADAALAECRDRGLVPKQQ